MVDDRPTNSEVLLYTTEDGDIRIDVRLLDETVWLTQEHMAKLFGKARNTITEHIHNVFKEGELSKDSVCRNFRHTASDGKTYQVEHCGGYLPYALLCSPSSVK